MPAESLPLRQVVLSIYRRTQQNAPLPNDEVRRNRQLRSFGRRLSPVGLSVREHLTSELLRFL
jgi:hypothetical protein